MKKYAAYLLVHLLLLTVLYSTVGIFSEELAEMANAAAHNGLFVEKPIHLFNNSNNFTVVTHFIASLKEQLPAFNVHGLYLLFMTAVYLTNFFVIGESIFNADANNEKPKYYKILLLVGIYVILINDVLFTQYTRISFYLLCSGVLLYNISSRWLYKGIALFSVINALFIRFDTFFVVVPLLLAYRLILFGEINKQLILQLLKKNAVFLACIAIIVVISDINFTKADKTYEPYRSIIYSFECYQAKGEEFNLNTTLDSIRYEMVKNHFYNEISIQEMYDIGIKPKDRDVFSFIDNFNGFSITKGITDFVNFYKYNKAFIYTYLLVCIAIVLLLSAGFWRRVVFIFLLTILLIFLICIYIKTEDRVAFPLMNICMLSVLFFSFYKQPKTVANSRMLLLAVVFIMLLFKNIDIQKIKHRQRIERDILAVQAYFKSNKQVKTVYWDLMLFYLFLNKEVSTASLYNSERDYMLDNSLFYITDEYRNRMLKRFGTYRFMDIVQQSLNKPEAVFLTTSDKMDFYLRYIYYRYGIILKAEKVRTEKLFRLFDNEPSTDYYLFYLRK